MATLDLAFAPRALPGPAPALGPAEAHVWRVSLAAPLADPKIVVSAEEAARAARMRHTGARTAFLHARVALRLILGAYVEEDPVSLRIVPGARGKPWLDAPNAPCFNLSHSGDLGLIAICAAPVGVDVERVRETPNLDAVAARFFAEPEVEALRALPDALRLDAFFAAWTRKEAFVKASGEGIAHAFARFTVSVGPNEPAQLLAGGDGAALHAFRPAPDAWGAVCAFAPGIDLRGFSAEPTQKLHTTDI